MYAILGLYWIIYNVFTYCLLTNNVECVPSCRVEIFCTELHVSAACHSDTLPSDALINKQELPNTDLGWGLSIAAVDLLALITTG